MRSNIRPERAGAALDAAPQPVVLAGQPAVPLAPSGVLLAVGALMTRMRAQRAAQPQHLFVLVGAGRLAPGRLRILGNVERPDAGGQVATLLRRSGG